MVINLDAMRPAKSPIVLRPFLEAYFVVAETLGVLANAPVTEDELKDLCLRMGNQLLAQGIIETAEACDDGAETADSSSAHAATTKANAATANRLCRTKPSVTTPSPNRTAVPENHILNPVSPRTLHPTRPYRHICAS